MVGNLERFSCSVFSAGFFWAASLSDRKKNGIFECFIAFSPTVGNWGDIPAEFQVSVRLCSRCPGWYWSTSVCLKAKRISVWASCFKFWGWSGSWGVAVRFLWDSFRTQSLTLVYGSLFQSVTPWGISADHLQQNFLRLVITLPSECQ